MIDNLGIATDNFYKYLTTLSLVAFIYCSSFDTLFLYPYNKLMTEHNIELAKLDAERGYLSGVSEDLMLLIPDSVQDKRMRYAFIGSRDTSEIAYYYSSILLDSTTKKIVDSFNIIQKKWAEKTFIIGTIEEVNMEHEANVKSRYYIMLIFGIISFIFFCFGLFKWYSLRHKIDK